MALFPLINKASFVVLFGEGISLQYRTGANFFFLTRAKPLAESVP